MLCASQYLKRTGKVNVEDSERGFIIEYIDKEKIRREEEDKAKRKAEVTAEQHREKVLSSHVKAAWDHKRREASERPSGVSALQHTRNVGKLRSE